MAVRESEEETTTPIAVHESWLPQDHPLHRPRHGRRQRLALVCAVVFFLTPATAFALGDRPAQIENHRLAAFPSPSRGLNFFTGLGSWATDHLPLRAAGIAAEDGVSRGVFGELPPKSAHQDSGPLGPSSSTDRSTVAAQRNQFPPVVQGTDDWLYYGFDAASKCFPSRPMPDVVKSLTEFQRILQESGRKSVIVVPPDKSTMLPQHLPADFPGKDCMNRYRAAFWPKIDATGSIVDLRPTLAALQKTDPNPLYFKNDTHWQDASAVSALKVVAERIQPGVTKTWHVTPDQVSSRQGDLSLLLGAPRREKWQRYAISPDGVTHRPMDDQQPLNAEHVVTNKPTKGMITEPTTILGDSFSQPIDQYASNTFSDLRFGGYAELRDQRKVLDMIVHSKVVVLEMLERGVATGDYGLLRPEQLRNLETLLAKHPIK